MGNQRTGHRGPRAGRRLYCKPFQRLSQVVGGHSLPHGPGEPTSACRLSRDRFPRANGKDPSILQPGWTGLAVTDGSGLQDAVRPRRDRFPFPLSCLKDCSYPDK